MSKLEAVKVTLTMPKTRRRARAHKAVPLAPRPVSKRVAAQKARRTVRATCPQQPHLAQQSVWQTPPTGPERLEGERGAGVTNQAGETFAPGSDDVNIPGGRSAAEYSRAAEEAINEGRIPVEYQNILRDYFR